MTMPPSYCTECLVSLWLKWLYELAATSQIAAIFVASIVAWESGLPLIQGILLTSAVLYTSALYHNITWLQLYSVNIFVHLSWRICDGNLQCTKFWSFLVSGKKCPNDLKKPESGILFLLEKMFYLDLQYNYTLSWHTSCPHQHAASYSVLKYSWLSLYSSKWPCFSCGP